MERNLEFSKYNIFSRIKGSSDYFLVNILSGNADILSPATAAEIKKKIYSNMLEYIEKGYLVNPSEEEKRYKLKYRQFHEHQQQDEVQLFFVPRYVCNFNCSFCIHQDNSPRPAPLDQEVVAAFFRYLDSEFPWRRKYITICGGEPLMPGSQSKQEIQWLIAGAVERKLDISMVTNGYLLSDYIDILEQARLREIQVTLDGPQQLHDTRRPHIDGSPTFQRAVEGIDKALAKGMPVSLRIVVDLDNIDELKELAKFAIHKKWTRHPLFKTQLGRNYEIHLCGVNHERLDSRIRMYEALYKMIHDFPEFLEFHRPALSISRFLFEAGALPDPLFGSCPGTHTEWVFDYTGSIYSCTAALGKMGGQLGTFHPHVSLDKESVTAWENRASMPEYKCCSWK